MINKIKQLLCKHHFVINNIYKTYLSVGDKENNRISYEYQMKCYICGKKQRIIKKWKTIQNEKELLEADKHD